MSTIDDVYRAFGYAAEAAQLLETELGTLLFRVQGEKLGIFTGEQSEDAREILDKINRSTFGQLLKKVTAETTQIDHLSEQLAAALAERNRLSHSLFRIHNNRRNTDEGCAIMVADLEQIHRTIFNAYKLVLLLAGIDLDALEKQILPTKHLNLD